MKYKTKEEAIRAADMENMGRDYSTAYVLAEGDHYIVVIK